jgi:hypothetical protein
MMSLAGERRLHKYTPPFLTGAQPRGRGEGGGSNKVIHILYSILFGALKRTLNKIILLSLAASNGM